MKNKKTSRGFVFTDFIDRYGNKCSLQKSSLATEDCVWLGIDVPKKLSDDSYSGRMHLTQQQVEDLLPYLFHFVHTGNLPDDTDNSSYHE